MLLLQEEKKSLINTLRGKGIIDERILNAIYNVPREKFIPEAFRKYAYDDNALPIECQQTISQPFTVAYMTLALNIQPGDKVLEVGTGSGYQTAILCELGADVYTIERIEQLYNSSKELLESLGYRFHINLGDGTMGWEECAPYNKIIVTAGAPSIPPTLIDQLDMNGKMTIPVGSLEFQKLYDITKTPEKVEYKVHEAFKFVPLIGQEGWNKSLR
ncbi:MAG: protein-L-isoaspartate(D-aspartate) O-methyltransferase [Ignavibacteriae bacterium]|nr:MAG: protein-L-isoaspartate(D-aspartate) O-methyltransferase [Ignavibacteriota bacterium]